MELSDFSKTDTAVRLRAAAANGALSHALIFSGSGDRAAAARYTAAAMECTGVQRPCLVCPACRKVMQGIHPDVISVRDAEHKELSADTVRAMRADAFIRPNEGARKIYIFEDCTILTEKDQNILLKLVEEGPAYAAFFFCAENPAALLQTIRSRCAEVKLAPAAQERAAPDENALELARRIAKGTRASRAAFLTRLEAGKVSREALADLFEQTRLLLAGALLLPYGSPPRAGTEEVVQLLASRLTKPQILCTIDLLQTYRSHCSYNVGVGPTLGGFAVELEEIL
ncbi:MAG: DNA polymerase III subunit delta' [Oscillospiraceae bacterium]|nr:DNA polymerase III subunit delta' [Oscillospiraceae bacterium]